ncbi:MAG TPA: hypothetical protein VGS06_03445 [Streptosporangiaceae bacterium]|nr:hypothetical protein [Streptosporangiaceae bacterium]
MSTVPEDEAALETAGDPGLAAERDRLARTLRDTRLQLAMTQARLSALEGSATLTLGRTLVRAARRPWSRGVQLPLDLIRMWRERGGLTGPAAATLALASAQLNDLSGVGERFLSALTAPGLGAPGAASAAFTPPGLVVTGVLSAESCATLAPDAAVYPLLPHDADVMLESVGADVVLIEAAAMLASSAWAYAGDPAATDRGRRLGRLIAGARALGKPVIFVRNVPAYLAPGLDWVAASCDAVSDDGFGVQLARFNPIGLAAQRPSDPVYAGPRDPREPPAVRALLDSLTGVAGPVAVTGEIGWRRRPALYREHAVFVTGSPGQARAQRACGARVIMINGEQAALREQIAAARAQAPLTEAETLPELREIFTACATPVRLAGLASLAGLPGHLVTGRQIAVLARVEDAAGAAALAAGLRRQRSTPAELVVAVAARAGESAELSRHAVIAALADLAGQGILVTAVAEETGDAGWIALAAKAARSPWAAPWQADREYDEWYLLDLACARECAQADAVGYAGSGYAYVTSLDPALARPEFFGPDGSDHGLRLFSR